MSEDAPWEAPAPDKYSVTLKGNGEFRSPWVVARASTPEEAVADLDRILASGLLDKAADVAAKFRALELAAGAGIQTEPVPSPPPANRGNWSPPRGNSTPRTNAQSPEQGSGVVQHPNGAEAPVCAHGPRSWTSKISEKTKKPWYAWDCVVGRGGCERVWASGADGKVRG